MINVTHGFKVLCVLILLHHFMVSQGFGQTDPSKLTGHWEGVLTHLGKELPVQFDIISEGEKLKGGANLPDSRLYSIPLQVNLDDSEIRLSHFVRNAKITYQGKMSGEQLMGSCEGFEKETTFFVRRTSRVPSTFSEEEIEASNGKNKLVGTLVKPGIKSTKYPVIIFVHGSGNQTRQRSAYRSLAYFFASRGIAGLVFDRQGQGASTGDARPLLKMEVLASDVLAWVKYLKSRSDINSKQIGLHGLSQGGWVAPVAASQSGDVAFVIVDSAPGIDISEQNRYATEKMLLKKYKLAEGEIKRITSVLKQIDDFNVSGKGDDKLIEAEIQQFRAESWYKDVFPESGKIPIYDSYFKETILFNPAMYWEKIKIPVFGIWGAADELVPAAQSSSRIAKSLIKSKNKNYTFRVLPGAGHALVVIRRDGDPWDWSRYAPNTLNAMADWVFAEIVRKNTLRRKR